MYLWIRFAQKAVAKQCNTTQRARNVLVSQSPSFDIFLPLLPASAFFVYCIAADVRTMAPQIDPAPWIDVLGVLASLAKATPVLGAPFEGLIEALKQILQYTEVGSLERLLAHVTR
jgi:hypothetical protein